jgi:hypothetical protein
MYFVPEKTLVSVNLNAKTFADNYSRYLFRPDMLPMLKKRDGSKSCVAFLNSEDNRYPICLWQILCKTGFEGNVCLP